MGIASIVYSLKTILNHTFEPTEVGGKMKAENSGEFDLILLSPLSKFTVNVQSLENQFVSYLNHFGFDDVKGQHKRIIKTLRHRRVTKLFYCSFVALFFVHLFAY